MGSFFFEVPIHVDSFRFFDHRCPELIESPRISVKDPHIHQRHSLTFRGGQRLVLQCSTCFDILSCSYTLCIILITCQSLLLPNTSTHLLESHPFPLSLLSSFVITLLFSTSILPIRCVKPSFGTPSGSNL